MVCHHPSFSTSPFSLTRPNVSGSSSCFQLATCWQLGLVDAVAAIVSWDQRSLPKVSSHRSAWWSRIETPMTSVCSKLSTELNALLIPTPFTSTDLQVEARASTVVWAREGTLHVK